MSDILFPLTVAAVGSLVALVTAYAVAARAGVLEPATVNPFAVPGYADPGADTLSAASPLVKTAPPAAPAGWQVATLSNLSEVEDLLDSLEAHGVADREVVAIGNSCFAVRWK